MPISHAVLMLTIVCSASVASAVQAPANGTPAQEAPAAPVTPSAILKSSLDTVQQTVSAVKVEKWKRGTVREEAGANIHAILLDLQTTLPPVLAAADAAPGTLSKVLPITHNVDAMYDVLLRVVEAARVSAPAEQITPLEQALLDLGSARKVLSDRLLETATAQEKQMSDLRAALQKQSEAKATAQSTAAAPPCATPPPAKKAKKKRPPTTKAPQQQPAPAAGTVKPGQ